MLNSGNDDNNKSGIQTIEYNWYVLELTPKIIRKRFKFNGVLNGDVLELKEGCCSTFTSVRASLFIEFCKFAMR